jgi:hypothetical protein
VAAAEGIRTLIDLGLDRVPLHALGQHLYIGRAVVIILSWLTPLIVLLVAVRLARASFAAYCNWRQPTVWAIALAVVTFLVAEIVLRGLPYLATGSLKNELAIEDYNAIIGPGTWPWWYVLKYWPAALLAPLVEETTYRGFLWRGLAASRLGNTGAWLVSALFFALVHYHYYIQNGQFVPGALIGPFIFGLIFGFVRWRSGNTIAAMITHALGNIGLNVLTVLAVMQSWP